MGKSHVEGKGHRGGERVCLLQIFTLREAIALSEQEYTRVLVCLHLGTDTMTNMKTAELKGVTPQVHFHYPGINSQVLHARAEGLREPKTENRRPPPMLQLLTPINKEKLHNYIIHPP